VQAVVERLQRHAQHLRRPSLVAAEVVERREDQTPLHVADRRADRERLVELEPRRVVRLHLERRDLDVVGGQDERALDDVPQLAHVARPRVRLELADRASVRRFRVWRGSFRRCRK
jgi:hypothetical protein